MGLSLWCLPVSPGWFTTRCVGPAILTLCPIPGPTEDWPLLHWHLCAPIQPPLQVAWWPRARPTLGRMS